MAKRATVKNVSVKVKAKELKFKKNYGEELLRNLHIRGVKIYPQMASDAQWIDGVHVNAREFDATKMPSIIANSITKEFTCAAYYKHDIKCKKVYIGVWNSNL